MNPYDPEIFTAILSAIRNIMVLAMTAITVLGLYYFSRSWHALWGLLILLTLTSVRFIRD